MDTESESATSNNREGPLQEELRVTRSKLRDARNNLNYSRAISLDLQKDLLNAKLELQLRHMEMLNEQDNQRVLRLQLVDALNQRDEAKWETAQVRNDLVNLTERFNQASNNATMPSVANDGQAPINVGNQAPINSGDQQSDEHPNRALKKKKKSDRLSGDRKRPFACDHEGCESKYIQKSHLTTHKLRKNH